MESFNEREVMLIKDKGEIGNFTIGELAELIFIFGLDSYSDYLGMTEREEKTPGLVKNNLLCDLEAFYSSSNDNNKAIGNLQAIAKRLYCKLYLMEDKDVLHIRKNAFKAESFIKTYALPNFFDNKVEQVEVERLPVKDIVEKKNIKVGECPF